MLQFRSEELKGESHEALVKLSKQISAIIESQEEDGPFEIDDTVRQIFGEVLAMWFEDVYNDIGVWNVVENHYLRHFGVKTPFAAFTEAEDKAYTYSPSVIAHILWVLYGEYAIEDYTISPYINNIKELALDIAALFEQTKLPKDDILKQFYKVKPQYVYEIKQRLVALGRDSFLFTFFWHLNKPQTKNTNHLIFYTDEMICEKETAWAALRPVDVLADLMDMPDAEKEDLRAWNERHFSIYKVTEIDEENEMLYVTNVINQSPYIVKLEQSQVPFELNQYILGYLVPFGKYWYWSGTQSPIPQKELKKNLDRMKMEPHLIARFDKANLANQIAIIQRHNAIYREAIGTNFKLYDSPKAFKEEMRKMVYDINKKLKAENNIKGSSLPQITFDRLKGKIGFFLNDTEGFEVGVDIADVFTGFQKQGIDLTKDELYALRGFMEDEGTSILFAQYFIDLYGDASLKKAYYFPEDCTYAAPYLLRRFKKDQFRNIYPRMIVV